MKKDALQNLPTRLTRAEFVASFPLDACDFLYVLHSAKQHRTAGFAILNFVTPSAARAFRDRAQGRPRLAGNIVRIFMNTCSRSPFTIYAYFCTRLIHEIILTKLSISWTQPKATVQQVTCPSPKKYFFDTKHNCLTFFNFPEALKRNCLTCS